MAAVLSVIFTTGTLAFAVPAATSRTIASGSSVRGLSEVTITKSDISDAILPIFGRFVRSRSPPQPNTVMMRALAILRSAARMFSNPSGEWA